MDKRSIIHIDISTHDSPTSAEFYKTVFGWEHQTNAEYDYTMFSTENGGGGFIKIGENGVQQGDIVFFIDSHDIDADLATVESNGGKRLTDRIEMPGFGAMAYFSDPAGNKIGLWQSADDES